MKRLTGLLSGDLREYVFGYTRYRWHTYLFRPGPLGWTLFNLLDIVFMLFLAMATLFNRVGRLEASTKSLIISACNLIEGNDTFQKSFSSAAPHGHDLRDCLSTAARLQVEGWRARNSWQVLTPSLRATVFRHVACRGFFHSPQQVVLSRLGTRIEDNPDTKAEILKACKDSF